jgi:hypothetical protein
MRSELGTTDLNVNYRILDVALVLNNMHYMHLNLSFSLHFNLHTCGTQVQGDNLLKRAKLG